MSSIKPRKPYSDEEIKKLYPPSLELQLVQVLLRHGERTPVSARFKQTGLAPLWNFCSVANFMTSSALNSQDINDWGDMKYQQYLESVGADDGPALVTGFKNSPIGLCTLGQLTDVGRLSAHGLGGRLRHLYVRQLGFMPRSIENADMFYLRATAVPRALESMQEAFRGLYPSENRLSPFPNPIIFTRALVDENLYPNDNYCPRFASLVRAFTKRAALRWNSHEDVKYLNTLLGKYMPEETKTIAVDGRPRISGIMDTVNSVLAHGPEVNLPKEFNDSKARAILDKVASEEWFQGFKESREYRLLGVGSLMGDITARMVSTAEVNGHAGNTLPSEDAPPQEPAQDGAEGIKMTLNGCHDTTLASVLASLGAFENGKWPPYTSHIAIELFRKSALAKSQEHVGVISTATGWANSLFDLVRGTRDTPVTPIIGRKQLSKFTSAEKHIVENYFVRIRYNDEVMTIPGCAKEGSHLDGDTSFCTLTAFKRIVDKYTPKDWKKDCNKNLNEPRIPADPQPAGF